RLVDERRLGLERLVQRVERRHARGEPLAVARELEARVDAFAPDVGEIVDVEAREVARLLSRAERAERRRELLVERGGLAGRARAGAPATERSSGAPGRRRPGAYAKGRSQNLIDAPT